MLNKDEELRLKCLELSCKVNTSPHEQIARADLYLKYIKAPAETPVVVQGNQSKKLDSKAADTSKILE